MNLSAASRLHPRAPTDTRHRPRPHVCFIAGNIYPVLVGDSGLSFVGGAEVQQTLQIRALRRAGYPVSVIVRDQGQADLVHHQGVAIHKLPLSGRRGWPGTRFLYPRMTDLVRLLHRVSPDIVFTQTASEQVAAAGVFSALSGTPLVFAGASDPDFQKGDLPGMPRWHTIMYRAALRRADRVIVQNTRQQALLKENFGLDSRLIQNGYEESDWQPGRPSGHVLWAATVKPLKQPLVFIRLAQAFPQRQFVMVGGPGVSDDAQAYFDEIAAVARTVPNLRFTGHVPYAEVGPYFDGAALALNTSIYEGFPNTFLQAWLRGVPTVSFVAPESSPGRSGTQACADFDAMVREVGRLTGSPAAWRSASAACSAFFQEHHTMDAALQRYGEVFDGLATAR